jgi:Putative zinc-finger
MKCAKVRKVLPLYVGHDLDAGGTRNIAAHLTECENCRSIETDLRESRAWLESAPPPIGESDFVSVRRGVWLRIEAGGRVAGKDPRRADRLVLAGGLIAAALLAVFLFLPPLPDAFQPLPAEIAASPPAALPVEPSRIVESSPSPAPRHPPHSVPHEPVRPGKTAVRRSVVKIEFQTANPDVRVIWLVRKGDEIPSAAAGRNQEVS